MKIEKIELSGFKSFAERISIQLHPGITGIVGPNGCGKSNLVDAVKWLLGEQSAKSLRGEKMDELIFNGSQTRKPKGMAEVSLHISGLLPSSEDNGSGGNNITVITRRIYRSGESEYAINNNSCRLKDIKDLLLDTGMDVKNYFIFEQERISQLINAKPQERRFLIEEIAGVIKYKVKKAEALQKLEQSKINLQRINDIINEVKRQLNSLDRQVKKAERYKKLSDERRLIELYLAKNHFNQLNSFLSSVLEKINIHKEREGALRAEINILDNSIQQGRLFLIEKEKALENLYLALEEKERLIAENEKTIIQMEAEAEAKRKEKERLEFEGEENLKKVEDLKKNVEELSLRRNALNLEIDSIKVKIEELSLKLKSLEEEIAFQDQSLEEKRRSLFRLSEELSRWSNDKTRIEANLESIEKRFFSFEKELGEIQELLSNLDGTIETIEKDIKFSSEEIFSLKNRKEELLDQMGTIENNIESLTEELQKAKEELASGLSRLSSLRELVLDEATEKFFMEAEGLRIEGVLSDLFEVPEKYERAVEGILSERINTFMLSGPEDLKRAVSLVKEKELSRTAFFSEGLFSPSEAEHTSLTLNSVKAIDIVKIIDSRYENLLKAILRDTIIVESIEEAIRIKKEGYSDRIATIDGEVVDQDGIIWSGKGKEVLKRKREIKELEHYIDSLKKLIDRKNSEIQTKKDILSGLEQEIQKIDELLTQEEGRLTGLKHSLDKAFQEKERLERRLSTLHIEREESLKEKVTLSEELKRMDEEIGDLEEKRIVLESDIESVKNKLLEKRQLMEAMRQEYTELRMNQTKKIENYNSLLKEIEDGEKRIRIIEEKKGILLTAIEGLDRDRENLLKNIEELKQRTAEHAKEILEMKERLFMERQEIQEERKRFLEAEEKIKTMREGLEVILKEISELDVQRAETVVRLDGIRDSININYGINIEELDEKELPVEGTVEELSERLEVIRKKIEELGPVNPGIIEEYEEIKERYNFLSTQQEDLTNSIRELEEAIQKINVTTRKKLREAFEALNEKFGEVFSSLFGGGKASIVLTDENNILESGIEVIAQPPGKRLQNINLLSGGEKALTALSLLIASFLIKPAPLCILDEADAPLDDANIERFAKMLKELSKMIQFIVITHNKTTMSYCDYLYGVTMEEPGVSKIISLQLTAS
ncbi:MAG: chromosome segregation protein SMC [Thermodesulfovibrionales bacterium]|nr:chromosome segregation protein SMC [Thermodesulfovibrionales bacterium]